jgi:hypothetical protein
MPGNPRCCCVRVCQSPVLIRGSGGRRACPIRWGVPLQEVTEVGVINPAHAKALKGHKTDAKDCARLAELFECGLLRGSYIPPAELKEVRDLTR